MSKKEVFFVLSVTIISYALLFIIKSRIPNIVLNLVLISFYTMFLLGRLPLSCYPNENKNIGKEEYVTIGASLFFLICCLLACLFPAYRKVFGRIGLLTSLLVICGFLFATYFKRILCDMPKTAFFHNHKLYFRVLLIWLTNILLISICTYSYKVQYQGGRLISKTVKDGLDSYHTEYVDSLRNYVTHVEKKGNPGKGIRSLKYDIYYKRYPDEINYIDTIEVVRNSIKSDTHD